MKHLAFPALLLCCFGCSSPQKSVVEPAPPASKSPVPSVTATNPEITVNSRDGNSQYVVRGEQSEIHVIETGPDYGDLANVSGKIYQLVRRFASLSKQPFVACLASQGELVSQFQSTSAHIDRDKESLKLTGNVRVTGEDQGLLLTAQEVVYDQRNKVILANGLVTVTSPAMVLGPLPHLNATQDLKKIATPGKFK